ncbi:MerR family DNA-binding transcriptional regulator [Sporichthya sp.]|uniref:MerR family transcriptional regulator n=1 Tax=Sporichthya sp. TaxID=65475 RepID=UPI00183DC977|nr:MerR family DNA-binding transcriptional regulator [Sporichthya sp.]MBA3744246.1 MerR family DNA-binding transcriptional regulator [Sporichthya sp.]
MSEAAQEFPDRETWSIAELAAEFAVTLRTIRFYEDLGLISPGRRGTQRVFGSRDRIRLKLILRGRRLGMTLDEIRTIIDMYDAEPGEVGQLHYLLEQLDARRADLEERRRDIEDSLIELDRVEAKVRADLAGLSSQLPGQHRPSRSRPGSAQ